MPAVPVLFYAGLVVTAIGLALLIYAAVTRQRVADDDDSWWMKLLDWVNEHLGPAGVVGVLVLAVGLFMTAWGWGPEMVTAWIQALSKLFGNTESSPSPSPSA